MRVKKIPDKSVHQTNKQMQQMTKTTNKPIPVRAPSPCNDSISTIPSFQEALHFKPLIPSISQNTGIIGSERSVSPAQQQEKSSVNNCNNGNNNDNNDNNNNMNNIKNDECDGVNGHRSMFQGVSLKDFENHRKMIEEQNRQKKDLLAKALEQRYVSI